MKLHLDDSFCIGCAACVVACLDLHDLPSKALLSIGENCVMEKGEPVVSHQLHTCLQCKDPFCMEACREKAIRREEGVVMIDGRECIGCGSCADACPTSSIVMVKAGTLSKALKCELCGGKPRCVSACPYAALEVTE